MRILLMTDHQYPAYGATGSGLHPRAFPSGSAYHLHDLLARGLAEEGHQVFYKPTKGASTSLPAGVTLVSDAIPDFDILHAPEGPPTLAERATELAENHRAPHLLTCHMLRPNAVARPNWVFVSRSLALAHHSQRIVINGIDPGDNIFSESKQDYFLFIGAMNKAIDKGLDVALSLSIRKGFRLIVAGTGMDYATIENVSHLCAEAGAEYVGDVRGARKAELLAGARALLFPSRLKEGCPLVILEAMMSGTPVISSTHGGNVEIVTAETGVLCANEQEWDAAVERIHTISPARCRHIAIEKFHYRRMVADYLREYQQEIDSYSN